MSPSSPAPSSMPAALPRPSDAAASLEDALVARLRAQAEARLPFHLDMLRAMVEINSFTDNHAGVSALAAMTAGAFEGLGFRAERVPSREGFADHLILTRPGRAGAPVGLVSHLDTVYPAEEEARCDFRWREVDGRIYGPGTMDIKGGTALIHMTLDALRAAAPEVFEAATWVLCLNASEERLCADFGALVRERLGTEARACLVFEHGGRQGADWQIVTARKGMATFRVEVTGRGAHAGMAHDAGANAVVQLARTVDRIAALTDYERDLTVNVGHVTGGSVANRVPHEARAILEMRAFDPAVLDEAVSRLHALVDEADVATARGDFVCDIAVHGEALQPPWPRNPSTRALFRLWQAAAARCGLSVAPQHRGGLSDGNFLWHALPTLDGLGPAGANAHCSQQDPARGKEQEYVERDSFVPRAVANAAALCALLADDLPDPDPPARDGAPA